MKRHARSPQAFGRLRCDEVAIDVEIEEGVDENGEPRGVLRPVLATRHRDVVIRATPAPPMPAAPQSFALVEYPDEPSSSHPPIR